MGRAFLVFWVAATFASGAARAAATVREPSQPFEPFRVLTENTPQAEIAAWLLPASPSAPAKGTLFMFHGYNNHKGYLATWDWTRDRENWNVIMADFRRHGESSRPPGLPTLGYDEVWDVKAIVDFADARHLPKPYVIYGRSLGGSTALRFASADKRIAGVFAVSAFKNAYLASSQLPADRLRIANLPSPFAMLGEHRRLLESVDVPTAVAKRDDLRIWIVVGEFDSFPEADQREILAASASPPGMKRLIVAKGCNHHTTWWWRGEPGCPGHDESLLAFLNESLPPAADGRATAVLAVGAADRAANSGGAVSMQTKMLIALAGMIGAMFATVFVRRARAARP